MTLFNLSDKLAMRMMMMMIKGENTEDFPEMYLFQTKKKRIIFDMVFLNDIHLILL
jgi:hypothetical protein